MIRLMSALCAMVVAALAMADCTVQFATGEGMARGGDRAGHFALGARRVDCDGEVRIGGSFRFTMATSNVIGTDLVLPAVQRMSVHERTAELGGPAILHVREGGIVRRIEGHCGVVAVDNGPPTAAHRDTLAIRFVAANTTHPPFEFRGEVTHGDIRVGTAANYCRMWHAHGRGTAMSENNRRGEFDFTAMKQVCGDVTRIGGNLSFVEMASNVTGRHVEIRLPNVREFHSDGNVAEFSGPGVMILRTRDGLRRFEGIVHARVQDNRRPGGAGKPDTITLRFVGNSANAAYSFAGSVGRGDIVVGQR
ncbi:MAG: hypothetical protein HUU60_08650 [Armatimonadetes bacterium]|nr:hypothetical protein [Armatimonadota bacterium]